MIHANRIYVKGFTLAGAVNFATKGDFVSAEGNDFSIMSYKFVINFKNSFRATVSVQSVTGSGQPIPIPDPVYPAPDPFIDTEPCELTPYIDLVPGCNPYVDALDDTDITKISREYRGMVVYSGIPSPVNINYTGGATLLYNGSGGGSGSGSGNFKNTTPTLLSGYIGRVNNILVQLISTKNKITALERLNVLEQQMELARSKGVF